MKKILVLLFITASFLIQAKDGFKIIKTDENSVTVEYTFSALEKSPVTINNKTYQKLSANNCVGNSFHILSELEFSFFGD